MSAFINFLSNPAVGGIASILTILTTIWGMIERGNVKKLTQEINALKMSKETEIDQRLITTHDRSTYIDQAADVTINHGEQ